MLAQFYQWEALSTPFQCSNCTGTDFSISAYLWTCSRRYTLVRSLSQEGTNAKKRLLISKLPQVLHVVLRRFRSLPQTNLRRPTSRQARQLSHKITLHVNFDEYLDMAPYCAQSTLTSPSTSRSKQSSNWMDKCLYRLRGVIVHYGKSINTGHFVAFVYNDSLGKNRSLIETGANRFVLPLGEWLRCDDHLIEQTTFESVKTSDAYILVYSRCSSTSVSTPIPRHPSSERLPLRVARSHRRFDFLLQPHR